MECFESSYIGIYQTEDIPNKWKQLYHDYGMLFTQTQLPAYKRHHLKKCCTTPVVLGRWQAATNRHTEGPEGELVAAETSGLMLDSGRMTVSVDPHATMDNRTVRASCVFNPGSGLHYFEVLSLCPSEVSPSLNFLLLGPILLLTKTLLAADDAEYYIYIGIAHITEASNIPSMTMWCRFE